MNTTMAVRNRILQLCHEREITINGLAIISGLPPSSINNILYGKNINPKIITIKMICDGLNITLILIELRWSFLLFDSLHYGTMISTNRYLPLFRHTSS